MNSKTTIAFRKLYKKLPVGIQQKSKEAYRQFRVNPWHPSLQFKQVHSTQPIFSARISRDYRAVAVMQEIDIIWFWIGSHNDYDKLLKKM